VAVDTTFKHDALLYKGIDDFVDACAPLLQQAVDDGVTALVAADEARIGRLRAAVGDEGVEYVDMAPLGRNPARILPRWRQFVSEHAGEPLFGIGEPVWPGRSASELDECHRHEALINLALAGTDMHLVCPYDASTLGDEELAVAEHTHPHVVERGTSRPSERYRDDLVIDLTGDLSPPPTKAVTIPFGPHELSHARHAVADASATRLLSPMRVDDMVLCVSELASNAIEHGAGHGVIRLWVDPGAVVCEVADRGRIDDPLVGRSRPDLGYGRGRGIWMVNQICDLVELRSSADGTVVRFHLSLD
jgi:anti-sigma regulatory factor (Ser/Thr protein kinase)